MRKFRIAASEQGFRRTPSASSLKSEPGSHQYSNSSTISGGGGGYNSTTYESEEYTSYQGGSGGKYQGFGFEKGPPRSVSTNFFEMRSGGAGSGSGWSSFASGWSELSAKATSLASVAGENAYKWGMSAGQKLTEVTAQVKKINLDDAKQSIGSLTSKVSDLGKRGWTEVSGVASGYSSPTRESAPFSSSSVAEEIPGGNFESYQNSEHSYHNTEKSSFGGSNAYSSYTETGYQGYQDYQAGDSSVASMAPLSTAVKQRGNNTSKAEERKKKPQKEPSQVRKDPEEEAAWEKHNLVAEPIFRASAVRPVSTDPRHRQHGRFSILYNYIPADAFARFDEHLITYTTHGEFPFMENVPFLCKRWAAPVSMALYVPGTDFQVTMDSILHARVCHPEVAKWATFHLVFEEKHFPRIRVPDQKTILEQMKEATATVDCNLPPWKDATTYRTGLKNTDVSKRLQMLGKVGENRSEAAVKEMESKVPPPLLYPINVIRNVARQAAVTQYVLASDVELYPSANFAKDFAAMIRNNPDGFGEKVAFPMPIFEVQADMEVPEDKGQLLAMLEKKVAVPFHASLCPDCHRFPYRDKWLTTPASNASSAGMSVLGFASRTGPFKTWEPIYVGTNAEPPYDERLSWEGRRDKMTQMYALCAMNYKFAVLDSAFLVHSPGIKQYVRIPWREALSTKQSAFIRRVVKPELVILYGSNVNCTL
ncbi:unnamed protein product [Notodromas monacha]|uniref:Uncharacterized protein n=1 Tax=Notodromas monacha TaxID=399045 RepID=A0A7R9G7V3_9CRUS|nr:unnamed protein product [Notodromas monacha]CAG0912605.1 unnamed protein product [Notodromas monacha]